MSFINNPDYLNLQTSVNHNNSVTVNPVVLFSILDHSLRLRENETIAVGALLGSRSDNGEIEIRNSFPIPLKNVNDEISIDKEYFKEMLTLHKRVNSKETVIGWYSTGNEITDITNNIHNTFPSEVEPVLLLVDTTLSDKKLGIKVFKRSYMGSENMFLELPCETKYFEAENSGLDIISSARDANTDNDTIKILSDIDNLEKSILQIQSMLERVSHYVKQVVSGQKEGNNVIGRYLLDTMSFIPNINAADFEKMFNKHLQDLLVVVYIANLTRSQLASAERLQNIV